MNNQLWNETLVDKKVTYFLELEGKFFLVKNVPARVCEETGEKFFAPETVEKLQQLVWRQKKPARVIKLPVIEFAE